MADTRKDKLLRIINATADCKDELPFAGALHRLALFALAKEEGWEITESKKHPAVVQFERFLAKDAGKKAIDGATLGLAPEQTQYLENRIRNTWMAAWGAAECWVTDPKLLHQDDPADSN